MLMNIVTAKLYCYKYCCNTFLIFRLSIIRAYGHIISSVSLGSLSTDITGIWPVIPGMVHVQPTWNLLLKHVGIDLPH